MIEAVGAGVTAYAPGDEVWYTPQIFEGQGSYAEYHVAAESIGRKPAALSHLEAASLSLVGGTAWEALVARGAAGGESILIHGGAGGVGHVAIQLAKAIGARVLTTVRAANFAFAREMGADVLIDYEKEDYIEPSCGPRMVGAWMSCSIPLAAMPCRAVPTRWRNWAAWCRSWTSRSRRT